MSAGEKTAGQVLYEVNGVWWDVMDDLSKQRWENEAAAVIAHARPQIEEEYRKRYPTGFCDCACKMDEAGDNVLSLCNTHRDYVKEREAEARAAAIEDAIKKIADTKTDYELSCADYELLDNEIRAIASAPPGHVCVPVAAIESIKEDKIFPDSGFSEEYIRGYNESCSEHYDELKDYLPTRTK